MRGCDVRVTSWRCDSTTCFGSCVSAALDEAAPASVVSAVDEVCSGATGHTLQPFFVPLLLARSAVKFALVAMFYMHLKQDHRLFSGVFVFPLIIATVIILALIVLEAYHFAFAKAGG